MRSPTAIDTFTGISFDLLDPKPENVRIEDVAHHTANMGRFSGATSRLYTVAEHQVFVCRLMEKDGLHPELCYAGLTHDAHEAYVGDASSPMKKALGEAWMAIEKPVQLCVMKALGVAWDEAVEALVRRYDLIARRAEAHAFMEGRGESWNWGDVPLVLDHGLVPYLPLAAEKYYLYYVGRYRSARDLRGGLTVG